MSTENPMQPTESTDTTKDEITAPTEIRDDELSIDEQRMRAYDAVSETREAERGATAKRF